MLGGSSISKKAFYKRCQPYKIDFTEQYNIIAKYTWSTVEPVYPHGHLGVETDSTLVETDSSDFYTGGSVSYIKPGEFNKIKSPPFFHAHFDR